MKRTASITTKTVFLMALAATAASAGDLNPPAGPVGPTMKPLSQVEPRIPITAATTPPGFSSTFRITQPGSYYLTGNLAGAPNKDGIEVTASFVTIDLCGFSVLGDGSASSGIALSGQDCAILNGVVQGWGASGIVGSGEGHRVEGVSTIDNANYGMLLGGKVRVIGCATRLNGGIGMSLGSNCRVENCVASGNGTLSSHNGIHAGDRGLITNCVAEGNSGVGIRVNQGGRVVNCQASDNAVGIQTYAGGYISGSLCQLNSDDGISAGPDTTVTGCHLLSNGDDGMQLADDCLAVENHCQSNGPTGAGAGVYITGINCRVEGNQLLSNKYGILVTGGATNNFIVKNTARNNVTANFSVPAGNEMAPVVTDPGASGFGTATPWSNFAY